MYTFVVASCLKRHLIRLIWPGHSVSGAYVREDLVDGFAIKGRDAEEELVDDDPERPPVDHVIAAGAA